METSLERKKELEVKEEVEKQQAVEEAKGETTEEPKEEKKEGKEDAEEQSETVPDARSISCSRSASTTRRRPPFPWSTFCPIGVSLAGRHVLM